MAGTLRISASSLTVMNSLTRTSFFSTSAAAARMASISSRDPSSRVPRRLDPVPPIWRIVREMLAETASWSTWPRFPFLRRPADGAGAPSPLDPGPAPPGRRSSRRETPPPLPEPGVADATGRGGNGSPLVTGRGRGAPGTTERGRGRSGVEYGPCGAGCGVLGGDGGAGGVGVTAASSADASGFAAGDAFSPTVTSGFATGVSVADGRSCASGAALASASTAGSGSSSEAACGAARRRRVAGFASGSGSGSGAGAAFALALAAVFVFGLPAALTGSPEPASNAALVRRRRAGVADGAAAFAARARFSRSQRARARATWSSVSCVRWLRTTTSSDRSIVMTSSLGMPNSAARS